MGLVFVVLHQSAIGWGLHLGDRLEQAGIQPHVWTAFLERFNGGIRVGRAWLHEPLLNAVLSGSFRKPVRSHLQAVVHVE